MNQTSQLQLSDIPTINNGYAISQDYTGQFVLKYYPDVSIITSCYTVMKSYSYDEIMRALLHHRESQGMPKEYWIL